MGAPDRQFRPGSSVPSLRDPHADDDLRSRGIAVVPFLGSETVSRLLAIQARCALPDDFGWCIDYMRNDRTNMRLIAEEVGPILEQPLEEVFVDHRLVLATFVTKYPGNESAMYLHEDRTFVDERSAQAATIWIPLVDVGPEHQNGGLEVVERSHLLPTGWAGTGSADSIRPFESALRTLLEPVRARAGDAVVYDTRLVHASSGNTSARPRPALACAVVPRTARLVHVVATGRTVRQIHEVDTSFFIEQHPSNFGECLPTRYPVVETIIDHELLTPEVLADVLGVPAPVPEPVVPWDLRDGTPMTALAPIDGAAARFPLSSFDAPLNAASLGSQLAGRLCGVELRPLDGSAPAGLLNLGGTNDPYVQGLLEQATEQLGTEPARLVLVADPGARCTLKVDKTVQTSTSLDVVDAPSVGAGLLTDGRASSLDGSRMFWLQHGTDFTMWNDGPGPLVALVSLNTPVLTPTVRHQPRRRNLRARLAALLPQRGA